MKSEALSTQKLSEVIATATHALITFKYQPETLRKFKAVWNQLIRYAQDQSTPVYSVELGQNFLRDTFHLEAGAPLARKDYGKARAIQILTNVYLHQAINLRRKHPAFRLPSAFQTDIDGFLQDSVKRAISESTHEHLLYDLNQFVAFLVQKGIPEFGEVTVQDLHAYVSTLTDYSPCTLRHTLRTLRRLFVYLSSLGLASRDLAISIPTLKGGTNGSALLSVYTEDELMKLLQTVDRANPIGKRDYAVLLLAVKLGLRRSDVRNLKLAHLQWDTPRIAFAQEKTGQVLSLPLLEEVGVALIDYLKHGRPPVVSEYVFLKHVPPYDQLSPVGFNNIANKYFRLAGIPLPKGKKHGLHALRHSLASHLLENQTPIGVISQILGHLNSRTTGVYLKIDRQQLRTCALEVPDVAK
jgi:integrase/recombinase XerD